MLYIRDIWELQLRLAMRTPKTVDTLLDHTRFRAAYDFLLLRAEAGEDVQEVAAWWTQYQSSNPEKRAAMLKEIKLSGKKKNNRKRTKRKKPPPIQPEV